MDEARAALAFVAKRAARGAMPAMQWAHVLSLELGWMTPGEARNYVGRAQAAGLLVADGDALRPSFDTKAVDVPRGFRPDPGMEIATAPADPFRDLLGRVAAHMGRPEGDVLAQMTIVQERYGGLLDAEAALLVVAQAAGMEVRAAALDAISRATGSG